MDCWKTETAGWAVLSLILGVILTRFYLLLRDIRKEVSDLWQAMGKRKEERAKVPTPVPTPRQKEDRETTFVTSRVTYAIRKDDVRVLDQDKPLAGSPILTPVQVRTMYGTWITGGTLAAPYDSDPTHASVNL